MRPWLAVALVALYALISRIEFPVGAGYVVPSYLVLVPMLALLPVGVVPLLTALGLVLGALGQWAARRAGPERVLFSVPDAWHAVGPAAVLLLAGPLHGGTRAAAVYVLAFGAGCLLDLALRRRCARPLRWASRRGSRSGSSASPGWRTRASRRSAC